MKTTRHIWFVITLGFALITALLLHFGHLKADWRSETARTTRHEKLVGESRAHAGRLDVVLPVRKQTVGEKTAKYDKSVVENSQFHSGDLKLPARKIPNRLKTIFCLDSEFEFSKRVSAVHSLSRRLDAEELEFLYAFLAGSELGRGTESRERWLRNDIMDKLVDQESAPEGLANRLVLIYEDHEQDVVIRDYAVQHMPWIYERVGDDEKASLSKAMWRATEESNSSIAGTALLALLEITDGPHSDVAASSVAVRERLSAAALKLASDERCGELTRITAVSVCGRLRIAEALPVVTQLAGGAQSVQLRMAAIGSLAYLSSMSTSSLLDRLATDADQRVRGAAEAALRRLRERNS